MNADERGWKDDSERISSMSSSAFISGQEMHPAFAQILGQDSATEFLSRALAADRLPHGLIFAGPVGTGRYTTAIALSKVFLAEKPDDPTSIATIAPLIDARTHPDFHYVTKEQVRELEGKGANKAIQFSVDVVRERILLPASKKSALGIGKVFVVEEAEAMNAQAQNALLKTLEEPSGRTLIILLSDQPHALLSTVRSRAQTIRFCPLALSDAMKVLAANGIDGNAAKEAIELADGSPGLAIQWHKDGVVLAANQLHRLLDTVATVNAADLAAFFKTASEAYAKRQLERDPVGSEDGFKRAGIGVYLRIAADYLRRRLARDESFTVIDKTCDQIDAVRRAEAYIDGNVNVALVLQQIGAELAS
jgi:DNA polymerase III subunit delta'